MKKKHLNIHLYPSSFKNESRIEKQALTISQLGLFDEICLLGTYEKGLERRRKLASSVSVNLLGKENSSGGMIKKFGTFLIWYISVFNFCRNKSISCVNVHSLSSLVLGSLIKAVNKSVLIYDTHELETETNGSRGMRKKVAKFVERALIHRVDHVFVVSESIADWYASEYPIDRPTVILNTPKLYHPPKTNIFRETFDIKNDQIIVLYQGGLGSGRGVNLLLSAFKQRKDNKVVIVFMGAGNLELDILVASKESDRIFFHPAVPPDIVLNYTVSADIGVSFIQNTCLSYYYCMPNKLFEYAMSGLPVIVSSMKEMRSFVEKYNLGVVVEKESVDALNEAIDSILNSDIVKLKNNARKAAEIHSWEIQEQKMCAVYESLDFRTNN